MVVLKKKNIVELKCKSSTETVALVECIFCGEKEEDLSKMSKKQKQSQKQHALGEYHTRFQSPNVQHVKFLTGKWRDTASLLRNTEILSKLHTDVYGCSNVAKLFETKLFFLSKKYV